MAPQTASSFGVSGKLVNSNLVMYDRSTDSQIHGFMDAGALERERIDACVFKTMTAEGPMSMCLHNAKRDSFILQPLGEAPQRYGLKHAKGRARQNLLKQRALS